MARYRDESNYFLTRANALENNVHFRGKGSISDLARGLRSALDAQAAVGR